MTDVLGVQIDELMVCKTVRQCDIQVIRVGVPFGLWCQVLNVYMNLMILIRRLMSYEYSMTWMSLNVCLLEPSIPALEHLSSVTSSRSRRQWKY